jgi:release factor glutamine methyltransferase
MAHGRPLMELVREAAEYLRRKGIKTPRLDAEVLMAHALGCKRIDLYLRFDELLLKEEVDVYRELVRRRGKREPVAYITGSKEFWSIPLRVDSRVLIPRPETETLVEACLEELREIASSSPNPLKAAEIGTGSGAVVIALAKEMGERVMWTATDVSKEALDVARSNAELLHLEGRIQFIEGDGVSPLLGQGGFSLIVSNPPYVPTGELESLDPEVRLYEPKVALDGGLDGTRMISRLLAEAHMALVSGGKLVMEVAGDQRGKVEEMISRVGSWVQWGWKEDLGGRPRVVWVRKG